MLVGKLFSVSCRHVLPSKGMPFRASLQTCKKFADLLCRLATKKFADLLCRLATKSLQTCHVGLSYPNPTHKKMQVCKVKSARSSLQSQVCKLFACLSANFKKVCRVARNGNRLDIAELSHLPAD